MVARLLEAWPYPGIGPLQEVAFCMLEYDSCRLRLGRMAVAIADGVSVPGVRASSLLRVCR